MSKQTKKQIVSGVLYALLGTGAVAGLASLFTSFHRDWYHALNKPPFTPPDWAFGLAWSIIYALAAASLAVALIAGVNRRTVTLYLVSGVLNILWPLFFFTCKLPVLAFAVLLATVAVAVFLLRSLYAQNKLSAWLLLPYLLWIIFALVLNYSIIMLN